MEVDYYGYKHTLILRYNYFNELSHFMLEAAATLGLVALQIFHMKPVFSKGKKKL